MVEYLDLSITVSTKSGAVRMSIEGPGIVNNYAMFYNETYHDFVMSCVEHALIHELRYP